MITISAVAARIIHSPLNIILLSNKFAALLAASWVESFTITCKNALFCPVFLSAIHSNKGPACANAAPAWPKIKADVAPALMA